MTSRDQEFTAELQHAKQIHQEIDKQLQALEQSALTRKTDIVAFRKHFWDDVTIDFSDPESAIESHASMKQQAEVLSERERTYQHAFRQQQTLNRLKQAPYFARIDFHEEGEPTTEQIYIGVGSLQDESKFQFLIYDWRAPVSSVYYDYALGPAAYETPGGAIRGELELKRQYIFKDGQLSSMFDTGIAIGDELLKEVLGKHASTQMKSIVSTIQRDQNQIIRNEKSRMIIVQGAAGSGKTSAALQRIAYLLYRYRQTLQADQIVLFSPNPIFNSYVATVLPELGEENMEQTTFQDYLHHRLGDHFSIEDPFEQMEYILTAMDDDSYAARVEAIRWKASAGYLSVIERYVEALSTKGMCFRPLTFRSETIVTAQEIEAYFYRLDTAISIANRIQLTAEWLLEALKKQMAKELSKPWVEEEVELLDDEAYLRAYQKLRKQKKYTEDSFDDFDREKELLARHVVKEHFKPLRAWVKNQAFVDVTAVYERLYAEPEAILPWLGQMELPGTWDVICRMTAAQLRENFLHYEDAAPYLYLMDLLLGFPVNQSIRHVFIDEAQDYSPFQFAYIQKMFPRSKMTVLGDMNQAIYAHASAGNGLDTLIDLFGEAQTETYTLSQTYRSTRQIVEFTRAMLPGGEHIQPFNREGRLPEVSRAESMQELQEQIVWCIQQLQASGHQTIAVITKTAEESKTAYEALKSSLPLRLIQKGSSEFDRGVLVIPSYLAKGVEFDAVVIFNASSGQYGLESERKLFYTACTRAMHELHIFYTGEINRFVRDVPQEVYVHSSESAGVKA